MHVYKDSYISSFLWCLNHNFECHLWIQVGVCVCVPTVDIRSTSGLFTLLMEHCFCFISVVVLKYPGKANLGEEGFILSPQFQVRVHHCRNLSSQSHPQSKAERKSTHTFLCSAHVLQCYTVQDLPA